MRDVRDRYRTDPLFHRLVQVLLSEIKQANLTPTEIREAAMLAQTMHEERNTRRVIAPVGKAVGCDMCAGNGLIPTICDNDSCPEPPPQ